MEHKETIYNVIGTDYNATRKADPYIASRLFELLGVKQGSLCLDIGCGTGNYTIALSEKGLSLCGVDPSEKMLASARAKSTEISWLTGTAENIPAKESTFYGVTGVLTLHHWKNIGTGFLELNRVLKSNSRAVFFTSDPAQMKGYWLNHYFPGIMERSINQMQALSLIESAASRAGFKTRHIEKYFVSRDLQDMFLYAGKDKPELYFDPGMRKGISSFAALSNAREVEKGLKRLSEDIATGAFAKTRQRYENTLGDYLFIVMEKP